ncbi:telomeric repeat-binding factor 2-interacting protein 1 isoform X2 [Hoplias malabaricus]
MDGAMHFYISSQYVRDCVQQNQQLKIDSYRFSNLQPVQTRAASQKHKGTGRMFYSLEDDSAILDYITNRQHEAKGNRIWQQMERQKVTAHSWQSMKDRFLKHLQNKLIIKSPKKNRKAQPLEESSSSDDNNHLSSFQKKTPGSSDSDTNQSGAVVQNVTEETHTDPPEPQHSTESCSSPQCPNQEENQQHPQRDEAEKAPCGETSDPDKLPPEEQQRSQQDNEQQEVSTKRQRMDSDVTEREMSDGPNDQPSTSSGITNTSKTRGRTLGILERAAREFEDSQMVDESSQEARPPSRASSENSDTDEGQIMAARKRAVRELEEVAELCDAEQQATEAQLDDVPGPSRAAVPVTSNAHMFIFDQESQEDLTQSQNQFDSQSGVEEMKQQVLKLMQECKKDLVEVMKALLKASGDVTLAKSYLQKGFDSNVHGPAWTRHDDDLLLSSDTSQLQELNEKYGADRVLKRAAFLETQ